MTTNPPAGYRPCVGLALFNRDGLVFLGRRAKVHGFRLRMRTRAGRAILSARRRKGRSELSA